MFNVRINCRSTDVSFVCLGENKCTNRNEGARFVDSSSCCHFHECISDKLILQTCPQPTLFDVQTRKCLPYKKVNCDGRRQCLNKCKPNENTGIFRQRVGHF